MRYLQSKVRKELSSAIEIGYLSYIYSILVILNLKRVSKMPIFSS